MHRIILLLLPFLLAATYMPTTTKQEILKGDMEDGHSYKIAFYTSAATCNATFAAYTAVNEVGTAGGYAIGSSGYTTGTDGTTAYIDDFTEEVANVVTLSSLTFASPAACGIIYNDTHASNQVLIVFDISPTIQPSAEDVTITLPTDDASNAIVRIAGIIGYIKYMFTVNENYPSLATLYPDKLGRFFWMSPGETEHEKESFIKGWISAYLLLPAH